MKQSIINRLKKCAAKSEHSHFKLGAVILNKKGEIIAEGYNQRKTHPVQHKYAKQVNREHKINLHAEIAALVKCRQDPYELVVIRLRKNGDFAMAKPCSICMAAIAESGIHRVIYSTSNGTFEEIEVNQ